MRPFKVLFFDTSYSFLWRLCCVAITSSVIQMASASFLLAWLYIYAVRAGNFTYYKWNL